MNIRTLIVLLFSVFSLQINAENPDESKELDGGCSASFTYFDSLCPTVDFFDGSTTGTTSWQWDFGDGSTSNSQNPSHTYASNGTYLICLTAFNEFGCSDTYCDTVPITCITPPSCNATFYGYMGGCPTVAYIDSSTASPGSISSWAWDFGDGSTSTSPAPTHTYTANGLYLACLTITTTDGCTSTDCDHCIVHHSSIM